MRWAGSAILVGLCAVPLLVAEAAGETPTDFEARAPLTLGGKGPYYQITLPIEAYLAAQSPDLRDLRVFNAQGDAVPFAMVGRQSRSEPTQPIPVKSSAAPAIPPMVPALATRPLMSSWSAMPGI